MHVIQQALLATALTVASIMCGTSAHSLPTDNGAGRDGARPIATEAAHRSGADHRALTLTVYQNGLGLVHDTRRITLSPTRNQLTLSDLPARLQPDTLAVFLDADAHVLRQRFRSGDWTFSRLLQAYLGDEVLLLPRSAEGGSARRGILISAAESNPIV